MAKQKWAHIGKLAYIRDMVHRGSKVYWYIFVGRLTVFVLVFLGWFEWWHWDMQIEVEESAHRS